MPCRNSQIFTSFDLRTGGGGGISESARLAARNYSTKILGT
jgi:hypothetical protein